MPNHVLYILEKSQGSAVGFVNIEAKAKAKSLPDGFTLISDKDQRKKSISHSFNVNGS